MGVLHNKLEIVADHPTILKPYNPDSCCGEDCFAFGRNSAEPCWGNVHVASEIEIYDKEGDRDYYWVHECEGHDNCFEDGESYKPEKKIQ